MKHVLCFGDSLTWGYDPETSQRFDCNTRWTGILQKHLGSHYRVIEEGLNGRTTVYEDSFTPFLNYGVGYFALPMLLDSHRPLDLVVLMLGTNDLQTHRQGTAKTAARGCSRCIDAIYKSTAGRDGKAPKVLLMAPPILKNPKKLMQLAFNEVNHSMINESEQFADYYEEVARIFKAEFLNVGQYVESSPIDGVHLDKAENAALANALASKIQMILPDDE
jgi:lysophospholipase L1-like esterase